MKFVSDTDLVKVEKILVSRVFKELRGYAYLFLSREDFRQWVKGMVGEGISKALNEVEKFDPSKGDLIYWCYLNTRTVAKTDLRSEQRYSKLLKRLRAEPDAQSFIASAHEKDPFAHYFLSDELYDVLEHLTRDQKHILSLVYLVGFSLEESADILKRKRNAVDALLHRAKNKAREIYRKKIQARQVEPDTAAFPSPFHRPRSSLSPDDESDDSGQTAWSEN